MRPFAYGRSPGSRVGTACVVLGASRPSRRDCGHESGTIRRSGGVRARLFMPPRQWLIPRASPAGSGTIAGSSVSLRLRVTCASPLYSRGVGCDWDALNGSIPSHSLFDPGSFRRHGTIGLMRDTAGPESSQSPRQPQRTLSATPRSASRPTSRSSSAAISSSAASTSSR
jgi:hypothetical protein